MSSKKPVKGAKATPAAAAAATTTGTVTIRKTKKVRVQPKSIEEFYKARGKDLANFKINDQGDLVAAPVKINEAERVFSLPKYRKPTLKEIQEDDTRRRQAIMAAEEAFQEAQHSLRETLTAYRAGDAYASDVVIANIEVTNREKALQSIAYPVRDLDVIDSIDTKKVLLDQPHEKRKFPYPLFVLRRQAFPLQDMYVREGDAPDEDEDGEQNKDNERKQETVAQSKPMTAADRGRLGGILKVRKTVRM